MEFRLSREALRRAIAATHWRGMEMTKRKEVGQLYGGRVPKGYLPAHNHVQHTPETHHGERGFRRFWIPPQWAGKGWSKCPCGWGDLPSHREPGCFPDILGWFKRDKGAPHYA